MMKHSRIYVCYATRFLLGILSVLFIAGCAGETHRKSFVLLHTNDSHGSILPVDSVGGMAERAAFVRSVREKNPDVLLLDAGDFNTGQAVSNMFDARPDMEAYRYMGYDALTLGNHEFDKPLDVLARQMEWAGFPFVCSNTRYEGKDLGVPYIIREIGGVRIGIFGLVTTETAGISIYATGVEFRSEVEVAREMVAVLEQQKVDLVVCLAHLGFLPNSPGFITSKRLAERVDGIDIIVDGHSHSYIDEPVRVNRTWIVTAGHAGRYVGMGKVRMEDGEMVDFAWKPVKIQGFLPDPGLLQILQPYMDVAEKDLETVVGRAEETFRVLADGESLARREENALGNLVADVMFKKAEDLKLHPDFALLNGGAIRADLEQGLITKGDILTVLPFNNNLEVVTLTGRDVKRLFDFVASVPVGGGAFAQVSSQVKVSIDRKIGVVKELYVGGKPVEEGREYHIATLDYLAQGKDGYEVMDNIVSRVNTSLLLSELLMEYVQKEGSITPCLDGRMTVVL